MVDIKFKYKIALSCIVIMMVFVTLSGFSYAYFAAVVTGTGKNLTINTEGVNVTYPTTGTAINLSNQKPVADSVGSKYTPYTFSLKNNNSYAVKVNIYLTVDQADLPATAIKYVYTNNGTLGTTGTLLSSRTADTTVVSGKTSYLLDSNLALANGATNNNFKLVLWISDTVGGRKDCTGTGATADCPADATMGKTFKAHITIRAEQNRATVQSPSSTVSDQGVTEGPEIFDDPSEIQGGEPEVMAPEVNTPEEVIPEVTEPEVVNPTEGEVPENDTPVVEEPGVEELPQNGEGMEGPSIG